LLDQLKLSGLTIDGFIARGVHEGDQRIGYNLEAISNGESRVYIRNTSSADWYRHGKYYFNPEGEAFGKKILEAIRYDETDLIVIDEIGPVELKGKGWAQEIEILVNTSRIMQLWVVRKPLIKKVIRQWPIGDVLVLDVGTDQLDSSSKDVIEFIENRRR